MKWLSEQRRMPAWWPVAAVLLLAALVRLAVLYGASALPFFTHHRLDALVYHQAGSAIAAGDWALGDGVLHMSPGYAYFVGAVYAVLGSGPWPLRLVQLALGVATVGLVYGSAKILLDRKWAIAAALVAALYGPIAFYETNLLSASLAAFLYALLLWLALRAMKRNTVATWALAGIVWGTASIVRPTALLFAAPLLLGLWLATRGRTLHRRLALGGALGAAAILMIAPVTIRNLAQSGELFLVTDAGGLNFYLGNGAGAHGTFRVPPDMPNAKNANAQFVAFRAVAEEEMGRPLSSREVNDYWYARTWKDIRQSPGAWLRLLLEKAWLFWSARELPNTHDYAFQRQINPVLGLPLVQYGWVAPLALLGLVALLVRRRPEDWFVATFVAVQFLALVVFFVIARYRIPATPVLLLTAMIGLRLLWQSARSKSWGTLAWAAPVVLLGGVLAYWPKLDKPFDDEYFKLGYAYHVQGDLGDAAAAYSRALTINRENLSARKNLARLYETVGDWKHAESEWKVLAEISRAQGRDDYRHAAEQGLTRLGVGPP